MKQQMIIRVHPDDRVEVKVEGLTETDSAKPKGSKLCDKITRGLERDLGLGRPSLRRKPRPAKRRT